MRRVLLVAAGVAGLALVPVGAANAHPLGNFTVNHADALLLTSDGVDLRAVVDRAEIPTAQALLDIAPDGDPSAEVLAGAAGIECAALAGDVALTVDGRPVAWVGGASSLEVVPGTAGLPTLRLTCSLRADVDLSAPARLTFRDAHEPGRVGWREITADGDGVRLLDSPVPVVSPSDELRSYPGDLLESPLDVRTLEVTTEPGTNTGSAAVTDPSSGDPFATTLAALDRRLAGVIGDEGMTPLVGVLALGLAALLGCGHALLPGHGKTVMAAYLAGRRGRPRDAVLVGATVTATHTAGVLVLGLAVSVSSAFAGEQVLRWLGVVSGALVAVIGAVMVRAAVRNGRAVPRLPESAPLTVGVPVLTGVALGAGKDPDGPVLAPDHEHLPGHDNHHDRTAGHDHGHGHAHGHAHDHGHGHTHGPGRSGLVGMGIAGGLVPSPSALLVLLASVGLGRTVFGVLLVLAYGLGMAGTLTAVGLALVRLRDRLARRMETSGPSPALRFASRAMPVVTAVLVLVVGLALVLRGAVLGV